MVGAVFSWRAEQASKLTTFAIGFASLGRLPGSLSDDCRGNEAV